jgi:hypothetical protein
MRRISPAAGLLALAFSSTLAALVVAGRSIGSEPAAHAIAFVVVILGLPWIVPAFVLVAVLSAPLYVALHIAGQPQELMPWLAGVILIAGIVGCHVNALLALRWLARPRVRSVDGGLGEFLFRTRAQGH